MCSQVGSVSGDSGHGSSQTDAYEELFQTSHSGGGADNLDTLDSDTEEGSAKVI